MPIAARQAIMGTEVWAFEPEGVVAMKTGRWMVLAGVFLGGCSALGTTLNNTTEMLCRREYRTHPEVVECIDQANRAKAAKERQVKKQEEEMKAAGKQP
ncbi:MAG: hypothetical protein HQL56_00900 [Magnetococcales bacterium]|nr:hypothetical protein [Magnetococcales bacterium]